MMMMITTTKWRLYLRYTALLIFDHDGLHLRDTHNDSFPFDYIRFCVDAWISTDV